jgi:Ethanolamine utilization protein EutJ (predicted chaperonin)
MDAFNDKKIHIGIDLGPTSIGLGIINGNGKPITDIKPLFV